MASAIALPTRVSHRRSLFAVDFATGLEYAEGAGIDPEGTEPISYTVELGLGATDEAGNAIEAAQTQQLHDSQVDHPHVGG